MSNKITVEDTDALIVQMKKRFSKNMHRHEKIDWDKFEEKLRASPKKLVSVHKMEQTGGEPDVVGYDAKSKEYLIVDCVRESPKGRTSLCYDAAALESRKKHKPKDSAVNLAEEMGIQLLSEEEYLNLQKLEEIDTRTSSWLLTPPEIRERGGAIFGDRRFGRVFIYHNGAESYYSVRGFRGIVRI